jgi:mannose-6-phosphate isomerase-like protein (cupin superfamily)
MALLRTEDGRSFVRHDAINDLIAPTKIDPVPVPPGLDGLLAKQELTSEETETLLARGDAGLEADRARAGWPPALAQVFFPGMPEALEDVLAAFGPPHTNPVDEVHHVLDGAVVFGIVLGGGAQVLAVVQPGDAIRISEGTEHWSTLTTDHRVKTILYISRPPGYDHAYTETKIRIV